MGAATTAQIKASSKRSELRMLDTLLAANSLLRNDCAVIARQASVTAGDPSDAGPCELLGERRFELQRLPASQRI